MFPMLPTCVQKWHFYGVYIRINTTLPHFPDECLLHLVSAVVLSIFAVGLMAPKGSENPRGPSSVSWVVLLHLCIHNTGTVIGFISYMDIIYVSCNQKWH